MSQSVILGKIPLSFHEVFPLKMSDQTSYAEKWTSGGNKNLEHEIK